MNSPRNAAVTVTFAGSGDAFGSGARCQACIHLAITDTDTGVLLDCGTTSLVALARAGINPNTIGTVLVSHLHVDHFGGIPLLILAGQFTRRTAPLTIAGPTGTAQRLTAALEVAFPGSSTVQRRFAVNVIELQPGTAPTPIDHGVVHSVEVHHGMPGTPSLGLRVDIAGKAIAYSGDTAWTDVLIDLAAESDLFIAEAYFWDKPVPYHLRHADLIAHRHRITSARVILTHMSTDMLAHAGDAAFDLAHDGLTLNL